MNSEQKNEVIYRWQNQQSPSPTTATPTMALRSSSVTSLSTRTGTSTAVSSARQAAMHWSSGPAIVVCPSTPPHKKSSADFVKTRNRKTQLVNHESSSRQSANPAKLAQF